VNVYFIAAGALAVALAGAEAYRQGRADGRNACQAAEARDRQVAQIAGDAAASAAARQIARIKVQHTTVRQEVEREIQSRVVYRDCSHSAEQLQRINAALTGAESGAAVDRRQLPAIDATGRPELRRDDAQADRGGRDLSGVPRGSTGQVMPAP